MLKKYPFTKQNDLKDCGIACLSMIIEYYKGYVDMGTLRDLTKTNHLGTSAYNLIEAARLLGFDTGGFKADYESIQRDNLVLPCIAHVILDEKYKHYVVIYRIDFNKKEIIIADPATGLIKMSFKEFEKIWTNIIIMLYPITSIPVYKKNSIFSFTVNMLKKEKKLVISILSLSFLITIFSIITSFFFQVIINTINLSNPKEHIAVIFIFFLAVYMLKIISDFMRNLVLIYVNQKIDLILTMDTFKNIMALPYQYYRNFTTGEKITRINDLNLVRQTISKFSTTIFIDSSLTICSLILLFSINFSLSFIALTIFILYFLLIYLFKSILNKNIINTQIHKSQVNSILIESISGFETLKGLNIINNFVIKFEQKYINFLKQIYKTDRFFNIQYLLKETIGNLGFLLMISIGMLFVVNEQINFGTLLTINTLFGYFLYPIRNLVDLDINLQEANNALRRVMDLNMNIKEDGFLSNVINGNIKISNLDYSYDDKKVLKNINLNIRAGQKILLIGQSGSGKSTLLKLIKKYYRTDRNKIMIDLIDINNFKDSFINQNIVYIAQNEMLFTETIINNIKLYRNIENPIIMDIINLCCVDKIIDNKSLGYNELIEENSNNISGGEKQRIILARSLVEYKPIFLIDEGFSQMDVGLERKLLKNIFLKYYNSTIVIASHRIDNMDLFDKVIELKNGHIMKVINKYGH